MKDIGGLFGCGEGGAMVKERGIVILYHQCHGRNFLKINKFVNLHGKS
jgi:hypothetical protein